tara:strand:+ start:7787 stop:8590 length:804 start_codon:yes stop_codon:yes gene_type:complete
MNDNRFEINLIGGGFQHSPSTSGYEPLHMKWVKGSLKAQTSIYVDQAIQGKVDPYKVNYGWLAESKTINNSLYDWCANNIEELTYKFKSIFTHDIYLSTLSDLFVLTQCSGKSFISHGEVYEKTKLVSMIASNKVMCEEHKFRQKMINKYSSQCDHYGRGYREIRDKITGLRDYCFSFAMENATYSNMFTEKLTDCFMAGTIPIYYGMENIGDIFDIDGIIILNDNFNIEDLSKDLYESKIKAVRNNFKLANELLVAEDYIYINFIK